MVHYTPSVSVWRRYSKGIAALLGTLTPTGLIALLAGFGVSLDSAVAGGIVTVLGFLATVLAPANVKDESPAEGLE